MRTNVSDAKSNSLAPMGSGRETDNKTAKKHEQAREAIRPELGESVVGLRFSERRDLLEKMKCHWDQGGKREGIGSYAPDRAAPENQGQEVKACHADAGMPP